MPQGSTLGPLLFNTSYMFFETPTNIDFAGYADDNTPYTYIPYSNVENVLSNLQGALEKIFNWFSTNHLVANAGKCPFLTSPKIPIDIHISSTVILNEEKVQLLGVNLEGRPDFEFHMNTLFKKASKDYYALATVHLHEQNETTYFHECFCNTLVFVALLFGCPIVVLWTTKLIRLTKKIEDLFVNMKQTLFWCFAEKGQISKYSPNKSANPGDRNL